MIDADILCQALKSAKKSTEVVPYLTIHLLDNEKVQPLLADWLEKDAKNFKIEPRKHKTIDEILAENTKKEEEKTKKKTAQSNNPYEEAYIDFYPYWQ